MIEVFRQERVRRSYARTSHTAPSIDEVLHLFPAAGGHADVARTILLDRAAEVFPLGGSDPIAFRNRLLSLHSTDTLISHAAMIASGRFPALGICISEPNATFDWHRDYGSGKVWPADHFDSIRYLDGDGADVKYVWELSRMYWIAWLGKAFLATGDEAWAKEFMRLIDDWRQHNPMDTGVNWTVAMEVGIRGFWLAMGAAMFRDSKSIGTDWWLNYAGLIHAHGTYTANNLEYFSNLTNHYVANCFGLVAVGSLLFDSDQGRAWFHDGKRRLEEEILRQVTTDGVHYERSICYHGLVLEMFLIAIRCADRVGNPFSEQARRVVVLMAEFTSDYSPPGGAGIPQFGDSDDGMILRLGPDDNPYDHRRLLALAAHILGQPDLSPSEPAAHEASLILCGAALPSATPASVPGRTSLLFPEGGFAILRNKRFVLAADVGPIGLHGNNDTLGFTLHTADGAEWIIDPGTGCYTRDESLRNELRSTAAHNAPCLDDREIAEFAGLWRVAEDRTDTLVTEFDVAVPKLTARHSAYHTLPNGGVTVERSWEITGEKVVVRDELSGSGEHTAVTRFTLGPDIHAERIDENSVRLRHGSLESTTLILSASLPITIASVPFSPSYGVVCPTPALTTRYSGDVPVNIEYAIAVE